jgi:hypothetical protein
VQSSLLKQKSSSSKVEKSSGFSPPSITEPIPGADTVGLSLKPNTWKRVRTSVLWSVSPCNCCETKLGPLIATWMTWCRSLWVNILAVRMIPPQVLAEYRERTKEIMGQGKPVNRIAAAVIITIWVLFAALITVFLARLDSI